MPVQELTVITKETQKIVLKAICETPTLGIEELTLSLKNIGKKLSQEEVTQVLHSISPNKNWHRATEEEVQKETLEYLWTLESQIMFLLPTKQKETTIAEFNQIRLQNKQVKAPKDVVRHIQTLLMVENKNLGKFRKFEKELTLLNDLDPTIQSSWAVRIILSNLNLDLVQSQQQLPTLLVSQFKEKFPVLSEKTGKTIQRICERFVEKYFPRNIIDSKLKELVSTCQSIYNTCKKGVDVESYSKSEFHDQNKLVQNIVEKLKDVQEIIDKSHEGGFLSKLFTGKVKNREGIISKIDEVINSLNQATDLNVQANKTINEKVLLVQKLQSDYENLVLVKGQLENDLYGLNDKIKILEEKNTNLEKDLQDKAQSLEKAHEKIASLQQRVESIPEHESKQSQLREDLTTAKSIAVSLYQRVNKIKADLLSGKTSDKQKNHKSNNEHKVTNGNQTVHKIEHDQETGQSILTTETTQ